jgi:hypothetical protein
MASPRRRAPLLSAGLVLAAALLLGLDCGQATSDRDGDGIPDAYDNCRDAANPSQRNSVRAANEVCADAVTAPDAPDALVYGTCANEPAAACLSNLDCTRGDACDCDLDGSGRCNVSDFNLFLADYLAGGPSGNGSDLDEDGDVDADDFARFEPLFARGSGGPGSALVAVVDAGPAAGACYDEKWARRLWASEGRIPSPNDILDCSAEGDALPIPEFVFEHLGIAADLRAALDADKNNPTDALLRMQTGLDFPHCPNASFSIASKTEPRACDAHDLCLDHCGTKAQDCNLQFYRDLFNTCEALEGLERAGCHAACTTYATLYATAIATAAAGGTLADLTPILSPPAGEDTGPPSSNDLSRDLLNCQCRPAVCATTSDCLAQSITPRALACDRGYCVQSYESVGCGDDNECPDGYRCDTGTGDCWFDVRDLPSLENAPPPVCGDGFCQAGIESCQATACPEDCGVDAPLVPGEGRCGLGDACLLDRDCAEGACLHGSCQRLVDGSVCSAPDECASDSCDFLTRHCKSGCLLDQDCGTGVCSLFECIPPQPDGSLCDANSDCASGACNFPTCVAANSVPAGLPCTTNAACVSGTCSAGLCSFTCGDDICDAPLEACGSADSGFQCHSDCGLCPNGTACTSNDVCASGVCNFPICIAAGSVGSGGTCTTDGACASGSCVAGVCASVCGDGTCTPVLELCGAANSGLECNADCGKCANGTACASNAVCQSGVCNFPICIAAGSVEAGGTCTTNGACRSGACAAGLCAPRCGDGACTPVAELCGAVNSGLECISDCGRCGNGTACLSNAVCASGVCNVGFCRAAGSVGNGGLCTTSAACQSGNCFLGICI